MCVRAFKFSQANCSFHAVIFRTMAGKPTTLFPRYLLVLSFDDVISVRLNSDEAFVSFRCYFSTCLIFALKFVWRLFNRTKHCKKHMVVCGLFLHLNSREPTHRRLSSTNSNLKSIECSKYEQQPEVDRVFLITNTTNLMSIECS